MSTNERTEVASLRMSNVHKIVTVVFVLGGVGAVAVGANVVFPNEIKGGVCAVEEILCYLRTSEACTKCVATGEGIVFTD